MKLKNVTISMEAELFEKVKKQAEEERRSITRQIAYIVDLYLKQQGKQHE